MLRRALAVYAGAFVAVAILAKAAIVGIGLPDWVFPGSLIVMALGLPVVLWTGYVQRVARRAMTMTPTYTPGGSPAMMQGTIATMALKAAPKMSWYKTARNGMYAFGAFIVLIGAFMAMRAFGIGPFGSLIASGDFKARDRVIITDFTVSNGDSALGRVVGDAIRAGLADSRVFTLMSPAEIAGALQRMQQKVTAHIDLALARQMALREGVKAIVDGDVTLVGSSYIVATRLITADSARELASFRGTASGSDAIINVADDLSRKLRAKAGESLRKVQGTPALAYASTGSLEALRKYSDGVRANDGEQDYAKAVRLLREAVALDSNFAEGWRKLTVALRNRGGIPPSVSDSAIRRAYELRDRMTERERDAVLAYYYSGSPGYDRAKAIATYERMLARGDSSVALNNVALQYTGRREYTKAESLYRASIKRSPGTQLPYGNLLALFSNQARVRERDSLIAVARKQFPGTTSYNQVAIGALITEGRLDEAAKALDSARKQGDPRAPSWAIASTAGSARATGRLRESRTLTQQARAIDSAAGRLSPGVFFSSGNLGATIDAGIPFDAELKAFDAAVDKFAMESLPITDRPYLSFARLNARAGRVDRARALIARYDAAVRDTAFRRWDTPQMQQTQAEVAIAERRWNEAAALVRAAERRPDGPVGACEYCVSLALMRIYTNAGMADSALAAYGAYRHTPWGSRPRQGPDITLGAVLTEQMAKIYDAKGDAENAAQHYREFVELWKNADPELQPRVAAARERLKKLQPVERPKHYLQ
jgi:tetratricopeptide (TPR) repeat protein